MISRNWFDTIVLNNFRDKKITLPRKQLGRIELKKSTPDLIANVLSEIQEGASVDTLKIELEQTHENLVDQLKGKNIRKLELIYPDAYQADEARDGKLLALVAAEIQMNEISITAKGWKLEEIAEILRQEPIRPTGSAHYHKRETTK